MKLTKIHKILEFKQSDWLKKFVILTQRKEKVLIINLKKISLNLWLIVFWQDNGKFKKEGKC